MLSVHRLLPGRATVDQPPRPRLLPATVAGSSGWRQTTGLRPRAAFYPDKRANPDFFTSDEEISNFHSCGSEP